MIEGRSKQASRPGSTHRTPRFRDGIEVVAMDGFAGFKTATTEELPDAVAVMDPVHVVRLAGDALDRCRRRIQLATGGHRGRENDPLYRSRRTLHTGADLLTDKQKARPRTRHGSAARTRTPTACCVSTSRRELTSRVVGRGHRSRRSRTEHQASQDTRLEDTRRGVQRASTVAPTRRCRIDRLNLVSTP